MFCSSFNYIECDILRSALNEVIMKINEFNVPIQWYTCIAIVLIGLRFQERQSGKMGMNDWWLDVDDQCRVLYWKNNEIRETNDNLNIREVWDVLKCISLMWEVYRLGVLRSLFDFWKTGQKKRKSVIDQIWMDPCMHKRFVRQHVRFSLQHSPSSPPPLFFIVIFLV